MAMELDLYHNCWTDPETGFSLDRYSLEPIQQAPVYQLDPMLHVVDRTQGREHAVKDKRYPDVKPRIKPDYEVLSNTGTPLWVCQSGGFNKPEDGWFRYGNGWTPEEAYAEWKADIAP